MCVFPKRYTWNTNEPIMYPFASKEHADDELGFRTLQSEIFPASRTARSRICRNWASRRTSFCFIRMTKGMGFRPDAIGRGRPLSALRRRAARGISQRLVVAGERMGFHEGEKGIGFRALRRNRFARTIRIIICFRSTTARKFSTTRCRGSRTPASRTVRRSEAPDSAEMYRDVYRKPVVYDEVKYEGNIAQPLGTIARGRNGFPFLEWDGRRHLRAATAKLSRATTRCSGGQKAACSKAKVPRGSRF